VMPPLPRFRIVRIEKQKNFSNKFCLSNIYITLTYFTTHLSLLSTSVVRETAQHRQDERKFKENILRATFSTPRWKNYGAILWESNLCFYYPHHGNEGERKGFAKNE
jgi:hypothetical protein